jgi:hypothetical protein
MSTIRPMFSSAALRTSLPRMSRMIEPITAECGGLRFSLAITASPSTAPVRHLAVLEHTGDPVRPDAIARLVEQFDGDEGLGALEDEIAEDASKRQGRSPSGWSARHPASRPAFWRGSATQKRSLRLSSHQRWEAIERLDAGDA